MSNQNEKSAFSKKSSGVVLKDVTKIFQQPDTGKDFVAVNHIDLEIKDGEMVTLLGPSGCGKTTTLRMISSWGSLATRRPYAIFSQMFRWGNSA